jgi:MoaA/NifB/PqqE/SkfB family radical SAM enzyme
MVGRKSTNLNINSEGFVYDCFNMSKPSFGNVQKQNLNKILYERLNKGKNSVITHGLCDCRGLTNRGELSSELSSCSGCSL